MPSMAATLHLNDAPLDGLVEGIPYPVYVENDASSSGYAEWYVRGKPQNMAYLSLEGGVGGAVLIGGLPYGGNNIGGLLSEHLPPYMPTLERYVLSGNPFEKDASFVQLSRLRKHIAPLGAALHFIRDFVNGI